MTSRGSGGDGQSGRWRLRNASGRDNRTAVSRNRRAEYSTTVDETSDKPPLDHIRARRIRAPECRRVCPEAEGAPARQASPARKHPRYQRNGRQHWIREAVRLIPQSGVETKVFVLERLAFDRWQPSAEGEESEYPHKQGYTMHRVDYYIVSPLRKRWWRGQSGPFIPADDLTNLITKAVDEATLPEATLR